MPDQHLIYAIDIGDAVIRAGVYHNGTTRLVGSMPTPHEDAKTPLPKMRLWQAVAASIRGLAMSHPKPQAIAMSASGTMTLRSSPRARNYGPFKNSEVIVEAPNVDGLHGAPIILCVERLGFNLPVHVENDMNAALTAATQFDDAIFVGLGAGLGAAIKMNGQIQHLPGTWSCFEIGHGNRWKIDPYLQRICHCGTKGCLEAAIGGWAMTERYRVEPENADEQTYAQMRADVLEVLPQAIAKLVKSSGISTVLLGGKGCLGYAQDSSFVKEISFLTTRLVEEFDVRAQTIDLGETAELHGAALALIGNDVIATDHEAKQVSAPEALHDTSQLVDFHDE